MWFFQAKRMSSSSRFSIRDVEAGRSAEDFTFFARVVAVSAPRDVGSGAKKRQVMEAEIQDERGALLILAENAACDGMAVLVPGGVYIFSSLALRFVFLESPVINWHQQTRVVD